VVLQLESIFGSVRMLIINMT